MIQVHEQRLAGTLHITNASLGGHLRKGSVSIVAEQVAALLAQVDGLSNPGRAAAAGLEAWTGTGGVGCQTSKNGNI